MFVLSLKIYSICTADFFICFFNNILKYLAHKITKGQKKIIKYYISLCFGLFCFYYLRQEILSDRKCQMGTFDSFTTLAIRYYTCIINYNTAMEI
jgi:hypothetical protein